MLNTGADHLWWLLMLDITELIIIEELYTCNVAYSQYPSPSGFYTWNLGGKLILIANECERFLLNR